MLEILMGSSSLKSKLQDYLESPSHPRSDKWELSQQSSVVHTTSENPEWSIKHCNSSLVTGCTWYHVLACTGFKGHVLALPGHLVTKIYTNATSWNLDFISHILACVFPRHQEYLQGIRNTYDFVLLISN